MRLDERLDAAKDLLYTHCMNDQPSDERAPNDLDAAEGNAIPALGVDFSALVIQDTRVFKAGNSLAIRIPSAIAKRIALEDGTPVEMAVDDGMIRSQSALARTYRSHRANHTGKQPRGTFG
jgi:antitoxin component of MazEF toxin-antitoxin module